MDFICQFTSYRCSNYQIQDRTVGWQQAPSPYTYWGNETLQHILALTICLGIQINWHTSFLWPTSSSYTFHFIIHAFFTQSILSFHKTCPYHLNLCCWTTVVSLSTPNIRKTKQVPPLDTLQHKPDKQTNQQAMNKVKRSNLPEPAAAACPAAHQPWFSVTSQTITAHLLIHAALS